MKNNDPIIKFVSTIPGLSSMEECLPKPSNKFLPDWWKTTPNVSTKHNIDNSTPGNIKNCPALPDLFTSGYIIPMWCDVYLKYNSSLQTYQWRTPNSEFKWSAHSNQQFLDDVDFEYMGKDAAFVFKPECPWQIITKPGYSVYQMPLIYHFYNEFMVLPGVIDTDNYHTINQQVAIFEADKEIFIKKGTPFVQYVPFKRESLSYSVEDLTEETAKTIRKHHLKMTTTFPGSKQYLKLRNK